MSHPQTILLAAAPPDAATLGAIGFLSLLLLAGALKCVQIMRRPTTSGPCVAALLVTIIALLVMFVGGAAAQSLSRGMAPRLALALVVFALFVTACVLAAVGLFDYRKHESTLTQGRAQAWWAAGLSSISLILICASLKDGVELGASAAMEAAGGGALAAPTGEQIETDQDPGLRAGEIRTRPAWKQQALEAHRLLDLGDKLAARTAFEQLFRDGYADRDDLLTLIGMYLEQEEVGAALATVDAFLARNPAPEVERWKGQLLIENGDHEAALTLFEAMRARRPHDPQAAYDLADAQEAAEKYAEALALCDEYAAKAPADDADMWHVLRGRCQLGLKWYHEARESFQAALAVNPRNKDARDLAALAAGLLGQGSKAGASEPIDPVPIPAELQAEIDALPELGDEGVEYGSAERFRVTGFSYRADKEWKSTSYRSYKVFGAEGVDLLSSLAVSFDPLSERVYVNRLEVYGVDGKLIAEGDADDYYVADDDADADLATSDKTLNVPVPKLKPGCSLVFTYTLETITPQEEFGFESVVLASGDPVQLAAAFVVGDTDEIAAVSPRVEMREGAGGLRYWTVAHPQVVAYEPDQAVYDDFLPMVYIGDKGASWENVGREHYEEIKDRLAPDADVTARARAIVGDSTTVTDKVARLAAFVQRELTYQGLEFGIRGQIPNAAGKTLKAGYGDCKDHAVLLHQMLAAVDVPAKLALILTSGRVAEDLPSVDQFDHMMVYLPDAAPERAFVDCTDKAGDPTASIYDCEGRLSLVLDAEQPRLVKTPAYPADGSHMKVERFVEIHYDTGRPDTAAAIVTETVTFDSLLAPTFREMFNAAPPQERKGAVANLLREYARVAVQELNVEGLAAPDAPLAITMKYRVERALHRGAGEMFTGAIPSPWEQWWAEVESVERRSSPFELRASQLQSNVALKLPEQFSITQASSNATSPDGHRFLSWQDTTGDAAGERRLEARQSSGNFPAEHYALYYDEAQRLLDRIKTPVVIELREEE